MSNPWWDGTYKLNLEEHEIDAEWGRKGTPDSVNRRNLLNTAFDLFYQARKGIANCPDWEQAVAMREQLEEAARDGWGSGVSDLQEAFNHVWDSSPYRRWTDNNLETYWGANPGDLWWDPIIDAPEAAVNFIEAMEQKVKKLMKLMEDYSRKSEALARKLDGEWDWKEIGETLKDLEKKGKEAQKFMWWAPPKVKDRMGQWVGFVDTLGKVHEGATYAADIWMKYKQNKGDAVLQVTIDVAAKALSYVPVLGEFYGKAVYLVIGLGNWFQTVIDNRVRNIDEYIYRHQYRK